MSEMVIKNKEEQARLWLYHKIDDLEKKLAAIRGENLRLRAEIAWHMKKSPYHAKKETIEEMVEALRSEGE